MLTTTTSTRSNRAIFLHHDTGSPHNGLMTHISGLGRIARLDVEFGVRRFIHDRGE